MAVFLLKQVLTLLYPPAAQTDAKSGLRAINHLYKKGFFIALGHLCQTLSYPGFLGVKIPVLCSDFRRFLTEVTKLPQHNIYLWYFFGLNHHFHLIGLPSMIYRWHLSLKKATICWWYLFQIVFSSCVKSKWDSHSLKMK